MKLLSRMFIVTLVMVVLAAITSCALIDKIPWPDPRPSPSASPSPTPTPDPLPSPSPSDRPDCRTTGCPVTDPPLECRETVQRGRFECLPVPQPSPSPSATPHPEPSPSPSPLPVPSPTPSPSGGLVLNQYGNYIGMDPVRTPEETRAARCPAEFKDSLQWYGGKMISRVEVNKQNGKYLGWRYNIDFTPHSNKPYCGWKDTQPDAQKCEQYPGCRDGKNDVSNPSLGPQITMSLDGGWQNELCDKASSNNHQCHHKPQAGQQGRTVFKAWHPTWPLKWNDPRAATVIVNVEERQ